MTTTAVVVGAAVGATVAVGKTAVKVPLKAGGAAVDVLTPEGDDEEEDDG